MPRKVLGVAVIELELPEERLKRVGITAPMDGVIVEGDLNQQLGAPIEKGQRLFEIAPLAWIKAHDLTD